MNKYHTAHKDDPEYKAKNNERAKRYYRLNREKALERVKKRSLLRKEEKSEYDRVYYRKNREKKLEYYKKWSKQNPDIVLDNVRVWRKNNPLAHRLHNQARRAKTNGVKIIKEEIHNWESRLCGICFEPIEGDFHIDHIIPLSKKGSHEVSNLQLTHPVCNLRKHNKILQNSKKIA